MADTRKVIFPNHIDDHATWWAIVDAAYPRLSVALRKQGVAFVSDAGWTTLTGFDGFIDGDPMTAALSAYDSSECIFQHAANRPACNFSALH